MGIDFTKLSDEELDAMHGAGSAPAPERPDFTAMSDEELDRVQADEPGAVRGAILDGCGVTVDRAIPAWR